MNRGFLILAQNTEKTNYVACAEALARNIKTVMPDEKIAIISDDIEYSQWADYVIALPYGDMDINSNWKLINDWQIYDASPFEYTIKFESDMLLPRRVDHWWDFLSKRDLHICTTIRDYKNKISSEKHYRQIFTRNNLPQTYNAITYFKKSDIAKDFFNLVKFIFENWKDVSSILKYCPDEIPTTDVVYSIAALTIGQEKCICDEFEAISMIHMKRMINSTHSEVWHEELIYEFNNLRINTFSQMYPFHYHNKDFVNYVEFE